MFSGEKWPQKHKILTKFDIVTTLTFDLLNYKSK